MIGRILLSAALLASTVSVAQAQHVIISGEVGKTLLAVDTSTLRREGQNVYVWFAYYHKAPDYRKWIRQHVLAKIDCSTRTLTYVAGNRAEGSDPYNSKNIAQLPPITHIAPETEPDLMRRVVCLNEDHSMGRPLPNIDALDSMAEQFLK